TNIGGRMTTGVCHPENPDFIWAGSAGGGVWQSNDAGLKWRSVWRHQDSLNVGSLAIDPRNPAIIYCGTGEANLSADSYSGVGIYQTANGGATWKMLAPSGNAGIPTRIGVVAIAPFDSRYLLIGGVGADESSPRREDFGGMFVTHDGEVSWQRESFVSKRNYCCHSIAVHPKHPNHVLCGGVDLHLTNNGGKTWTKVTRWDSERGKPHYAHADHHHLVMPLAAPGRVYDPNDGGFDVSEDGGITWSNRSKGLAVTMYYDMDVSQSDGRHFGGGAQDNGTLVTTDGRSDDHFEIL